MRFRIPDWIWALLFALGLAVGVGCSSNRVQAQKNAEQAGEVHQQTAQAPSRQDFRSAWDPEKEAAKIGVQLYPGAKAYRETYSYRRGNGDMQYAFFITSDSKEKVAEFYSSAYQTNFGLNEKGHLAALVDGENIKDIYTFELFEMRDGSTTIHVIRIHSCDTYSFKEPCDTTPYEPHAGRRP